MIVSKNEPLNSRFWPAFQAYILDLIHDGYLDSCFGFETRCGNTGGCDPDALSRAIRQQLGRFGWPIEESSLTTEEILKLVEFFFSVVSISDWEICGYCDLQHIRGSEHAIAQESYSQHVNDLFRRFEQPYFLQEGTVIGEDPSRESELDTSNVNQRSCSMKVSHVTRRNIFDALSVQKVNWSGRLSETDFLKRLFDLDSMPSYDSRFKTASGDIWQHRENNLDWQDDWIFTDSRFNLMDCDDETFLRFLCEMLHPVVRNNKGEVEALVQLFNDQLTVDGFEIVEKSQISGRPVFAARLKIVGAPLSVSAAKKAIALFNAEYLTQQSTRLEASIPHDPDLAIGTAKELVETCCKTILSESGQQVDDNWDLPKLVKEVCKQLKLTPDDIPNVVKASETIKRLLGNLANVTYGLAELRNDYGTGHGKTARAKGLQARHAKLAAGAATTLATFLFETYQERLAKQHESTE